jgi:hypothetical protein
LVLPKFYLFLTSGIRAPVDYYFSVSPGRAKLPLYSYCALGENRVVIVLCCFPSVYSYTELASSGMLLQVSRVYLNLYSAVPTAKGIDLPGHLFTPIRSIFDLDFYRVFFS